MSDYDALTEVERAEVGLVEEREVALRRLARATRTLRFHGYRREDIQELVADECARVAKEYAPRKRSR